MDVLDSNHDGKVDLGEEYIGYQIYEDMNDHPRFVTNHAGKHRKPDGVEIFAVIVIAYEIIKLLVIK